MDGFLLSLARHHLGRAEPAWLACSRALERFRSAGFDGDEAARDLALEALMTVRRLGLAEAQSLLFDAEFPSQPFAP